MATSLKWFVIVVLFCSVWVFSLHSGNLPVCQFRQQVLIVYFQGTFIFLHSLISGFLSTKVPVFSHFIQGLLPFLTLIYSLSRQCILIGTQGSFGGGEVHPGALLIVSWHEARRMSSSDSVRASGFLYSVVNVVVPVKALVVKSFVFVIVFSHESAWVCNSSAEPLCVENAFNIAKRVLTRTILFTSLFLSKK